MSKVSETVGWIVAVFAALGIGLGLAGYVSVSWGHTVFVASAGGTGSVVERFGPLFVSVVFFQNLSATFFVGLVAALLTGLLFGSNFLEGKQALAATGGGSLVGFWLLAVLALFIMSFGMADPRGFGLVDALGPIAIAGIPAGLVGAVAGYLGSIGT